MSSRRGDRLLVVTYHFPPGASVGGLRWAGLSKHLARCGWEVRVVSAFGDGRRTFAPSVEVDGRLPRLTMADRFQQWKVARAARRPSGNDGNPDGFRPAPADRPGPVRRLVRSVGDPLLLWPDVGRGWIRPALKSTRTLLREFQPTAIVSSGPPHSAHVVARLARGGSDVPWFVDLRDPWSQFPGARLADRWLEKLTLRGATGMIVTTHELRDVLAAEYPDIPVHRIPNGVDLESLPQLSEDPLPGLAVVHLGSLYLGRDPTPILEAFRRFLAECPAAAEAGSALRFVGDGDHPWLRKVADASSDPRRRVELVPPLPRDEALPILRRSSLALVLAQGQGQMIPAKLYESVALGVPTLVITERDSATFREAERLGALRAEPDDPSSIVGALRAVWEGEAGPPRPREAALDHSVLAKELSAVLSGRPRPSRAERRTAAHP